MSVAKNLTKLREMNDEELIKEHDKLASNTVVGINYYLNEIQRREQALTNKKMLEYTRTIKRMTWFIAFLTVLNVIFIAVTVFK